MLLVRSPHLEFFLDLSKTKVAVCSEPALRPGEEDVLDAAVVVLLPLGDVLQVCVEDEAVHHHVGRHEQPDVDHLVNNVNVRMSMRAVRTQEGLLLNIHHHYVQF